MLRPTIYLFFSLAALNLLPFHSAAFDTRLVQELIVKSGIRKQIEQIPQEVQEGLQQEKDLKQESEKLILGLDAAIESAFSPARIEMLLQDEIGSNLSTEEIHAVLNWLESPLGQKLTRLEEEAASPAAKQEMGRALQQLIKDPGAPERLKLLQRVESALQSSEAAVDMILNIQIAIISAVTAMAPGPNAPTFEQIAEMVNKNRPQVQQVISQQVIGGFLYTYRDVSDADLEAYIKFIESPVGSKYHRVAMKAFSDALVTSSRSFGKAVGELMAAQDQDTRI